MSQENTSSYGRSLSIVWRSYLSFYPEEIGTNKIDLRHIVSYKKKIFIIYKYLLQCPDDCTCLHDSAWKHNVITCSHRSENISRQFWENIFRCSVVRIWYDISVLLVIISRVMPYHCNNYHKSHLLHGFPVQNMHQCRTAIEARRDIKVGFMLHSVAILLIIL